VISLVQLYFYANFYNMIVIYINAYTGILYNIIFNRYIFIKFNNLITM